MDFKKILFAVLLLTSVILSCEKEKDYQSTAVITGPDVRDCICCGGYFIEIGDSTYNFDTLPTTSKLDLTAETFPLPVKLDWNYDKKCGDIQYIGISRIAKE
jgi:hypothetical protein